MNATIFMFLVYATSVVTVMYYQLLPHIWNHTVSTIEQRYHQKDKSVPKKHLNPQTAALMGVLICAFLPLLNSLLALGWVMSHAIKGDTKLP